MKDLNIYFQEIKEIIDKENIRDLINYVKSIPASELESLYELVDNEVYNSLYNHYLKCHPTPSGVSMSSETPTNRYMINLLQFAFSNSKTLKNVAFGNLIKNNQLGDYLEEGDTGFLEILEYKVFKKKDMVDKWIKRQRFWLRPPYPTLLKLEALGYVKHERRFFVETLVNLRNQTTFSGEGKLYNYLINNNFSIKNDILSIFDFEVNINYYEIPSFKIDSWFVIFKRLIDDGYFTKELIISKSIGALKMNFKQNSFKQYKDLIRFLEPTKNDLIIHQSEFIDLLNNPIGSNISFSIEIIKSFADHKGFDFERFIEATEPVLSRIDIKTAVKQVLVIYELKLKKNKEFSVQIGKAVCNCFLIKDNSIQEKAVNILLQYCDLTEHDLISTLSNFEDQISSNFIEKLSGFFDKNTISNNEKTDNQKVKLKGDVYEDFHVNYIDNWNDLLFQIGKALRSLDPLDTELLLEGLIRLQNQFPSDFKEQIKPYLSLSHSGGGSNKTGIVHNLLLNLIKKWDGDFIESAPSPYPWFDFNNYYENSIRIFYKRLQYVAEKLKNKSTLPLLSTPSYKNCKVSLRDLAERLVRYQEKGQDINALDFTIAIARIKLEFDREIIDLVSQLPEFQKNIILFLNGSIDNFKLEKTGFIGIAQQTINNLIGNKSLSHDQIKEIIYSIAFRTKYPDNTFDRILNSSFKNFPNVVNYFNPSWRITKILKPHWSGADIIENKLELNNINEQPVTDLLIYSFQYLKFGDFQTIFSGDINFIFSFYPNFSEPIYYQMVGILGFDSNLNTELAKSTFPQVLRTLINNKINIKASACLLVATGLLNVVKINRELSAEIIIQSVNEDRINIQELGSNIGIMLQENYSLVSRLFDALQNLMGLGSKLNISLISLLENIFKQISQEPPKNTIKLLEIYNELVLVENHIVLEILKIKFSEWNKNVSYAKQLVKLKGLN